MSSTMPASLANGRYQLGKSIGHGGMAEVYMAQDTRLGRTVAVKIMRAELANDEIFLSRFRREAHSVAQMNNPNIVNIYDSGEEEFVTEAGRVDHLPYLVMEYVQGQTLRNIIKANGALSQRDSEQVMLGVLNALEYSHRMGVIHRDIKPGNIMISEQGVVKVMDFGIARALDDSAATMTQSQGVVGTAQYLSPEQARGEAVDMRSDLYSAGCVLYEMLTGKPPFTGDSAVAIAFQHVSEVATPPSVLVPGLPTMWDKICAKAMAKDRQNRYATAGEFKNDILTFMNGGVPVAAAFNPLSDLSNMKAHRQAEQATATMAMPAAETGTATQAFNPVTGQFEPVSNLSGFASDTQVQSRAAQRAQEAQKKRKRTIIISSIVGAVLLIALGIGIWFALHKSPAARTVEVPQLSSSMSEARAKQVITDAGLEFKKAVDGESTEPAGTLTKSDPKAGTQVPEGSTVTVYFSDGPNSVTVPDVSGKTQSEAREALKKAGFEINTVTRSEDSAKIDRDKVTRTEPAANAPADQGSNVTLFISTGMTTVPDNLVGQTQDDVVKSLSENYRFKLVILEEASDSVPKGSVTRLDPASGSTIDQTGTVNVYISSGKEQVLVPSFALGSTTLAQVRQQLIAAGFQVNVTGPNDDSAIVTQVASMGQQADKGSTIEVTTKAATTQSDSGNTGGGSGGSETTSKP